MKEGGERKMQIILMESTFRMDRVKWEKTSHHSNDRCFSGLTIVS